MKEKESNFPRNFEISCVKSLADHPEHTPIFELDNQAIEPFKEPLTQKQLNSYSLLVKPKDSCPWLGLFWGDLGRNHPDYWLSCPDPNYLLVVTGFECFYGKVSEPLSFLVLPLRPTQDVVVCESNNLILIVGDTEIIAINEFGLAWHTRELAYDSVVVTEVHERTIGGHGDQDWNDKPFKLDAATGQIISGGV